MVRNAAEFVSVLQLLQLRHPLDVRQSATASLGCSGIRAPGQTLCLHPRLEPGASQADLSTTRPRRGSGSGR